MQVEHWEPSTTHDGCQIRLGVATWANGDDTVRSAKFTWFNRIGNAARGGEVPVEALPQMLDFAIRMGYLNRPE